MSGNAERNEIKAVLEEFIRYGRFRRFSPETERRCGGTVDAIKRGIATARLREKREAAEDAKAAETDARRRDADDHDDQCASSD